MPSSYEDLGQAIRSALVGALTPEDFELIAKAFDARRTRKGRQRAAELRQQADRLRIQETKVKPS
jgi:hypothetical protein